MKPINFDPNALAPKSNAENLKNPKSGLPKPLPLPSFIKETGKRKVSEGRDWTYLPKTPARKKASKRAAPQNIFPGADEIKTSRLVYKQGGSKSCGGDSVKMLISDIKGKEYSFSDSFKQWVYGSYLYNASDLIEGATLEEVKLEKMHIDFETVSEEGFIDILKNKITESRHSVILSITNPQIEGHFIIVDAVEQDKISIRDPYSGKALLMKHSVFLENSLDNDGFGQVENLLYVKST